MESYETTINDNAWKFDWPEPTFFFSDIKIHHLQTGPTEHKLQGLLGTNWYLLSNNFRNENL